MDLFLWHDCRLKDRREKIIENAQKDRKPNRHPDHDARKPDRFLSRRPVDVPQFGP
jgi:hypothetical protein